MRLSELMEKRKRPPSQPSPLPLSHSSRYRRTGKDHPGHKWEGTFRFRSKGKGQARPTVFAFP